MSALFLLAGGCIGWLAWPGPISATDTLQDGLAELNPTLLCILLLPVGWAVGKTRGQIVLFYFGYVLAGARDLPTVVTTFLPDSSVGIGVLCWLMQATILVLPWAFMWRPRMTQWTAAWRLAAVVLLLSVPPFGFIGWLNPMVLAGYLYPGSGWCGVVLLLLLFAMIVVSCTNVSVRCLTITTLLGLGSVWTNLHYQRPAAPAGWVALSTQMGGHPPVHNLPLRFAYHQRLTALTIDTLRMRRPAVLILPESVAGTWLPSTQLWWQPVAAQANVQQITVLVGADRYVDNDRYFYNSVIDIGRSRTITTDRFPMPFGQWRPWTAPSATMSVLKNNAFIIDKQQVALSVCDEDFLFWIHVLSMWQAQPAVMVSIANNWFARDAAQPWIQARHVQLWADLWGLPLLRALNH